MLRKIPRDLFGEIQVFLSPLEYCLFMNVAKAHFSDIKYETIQVTLEFTRPLDFLEQILTNRFLQQLKKPEHQLSIHYYPNDHAHSISDLAAILDEPSAELLLAPAHFLSEIPNITELLSSRQRVSLLENGDLKSFGSLGKNLQFVTLSNFSLINDLHGLKNLQSLTLISCEVLSDVSYLGELHQLEIFSCPALANVNGLGKVYNLKLEDCNGIQDISGLKSNHCLSIRECPNIRKGIEALSNVVCLTTDLIQQYVSSKELWNVKTLNLTDFSDPEIFIGNKLRDLQLHRPLIKNIANFSSLFRISLHHCSEISDLNGCRGISIVEIQYCEYVLDISGLGMNEKVTICGCDAIDCFEPLQDIPRVEIRDNQSLQDAGELRNVKELVVDSCHGLKNIGSLGSPRSLSLYFCDGIEDLRGLYTVQTIKIVRCKNLFSLDGLGDNFKIVISEEYLPLFTGDFTIEYQQVGWEKVPLRRTLSATVFLRSSFNKVTL
jgi:hypothetical protein